MRLATPSSDYRPRRPSARVILGLLAAGYVTGCLLPSEPPDAELIQFNLNFDAPLRVTVNERVQPSIAMLKDGEAMKERPAYRLVAEDEEVVRVDSTGRDLVGVARGLTSVRAVVTTAIGQRDTVFPVWVVVSGVYVIAQDSGYQAYGSQVSFTRLGQAHQFRAMGRDARGVEIPDLPFTWSTSDSLVAKVVGPGTVVAVDEGYAQIRAEVDGVFGLGGVTVQQTAATAVRLEPELDTLRTVTRSISYLALVLDSANRVITGAKPRWSSTDTNVARVSPLGVATATGSGTTRIIARVGTAADTATLVVAQAVRFLFVSPALQTITAVADTARFTVEARDSSGALMPSPGVTWAVEDTSIATVDASGLVTARRSGAVFVTATADRQSGFATVAVRQELAGLRLLVDSLALTGEGSTSRLQLEGLDRNGYVMPSVDPTAFTWRSQVAWVATVDSTGMVTAHGDGSTRVAASAAAVTGATDTAIVTVRGAPHELIAFTSPQGIEVTWADGAYRSMLIPAANCDNGQSGCSSVSVGGPAWSPDGSRLAFERSVGAGDIYTAWADGSDTVNLSRHFSHDAQAAWSPDGSRIAFWSNRMLGGGIHVMNADGSNVRFLWGAVQEQGGLRSPYHPTWSPDGTRLAFDQDCNIHVINADGSGLRTLTDSLEGRCSSAPAWSPDGSELAFLSNREVIGDPWLGIDVWVMKVDGSGATNLSGALTATMPSDGSPPAWSPLGSQIVFAAAVVDTCYYYYYGSYPCPGPAQLWVMSRQGGAFTQVTQGNGATHPSWRRAVPLQAANRPSWTQP